MIVNGRAYIFVKISITFALAFLRFCPVIFQSTNVHLFFFLTYLKFLPNFLAPQGVYREEILVKRI